MTVKESALDAIRQLPDDVDWQGVWAALRATVPPGAEAADYEWPTDDATETDWRHFVARGLSQELADPREDIYTLEDGEPSDGPR